MATTETVVYTVIQKASTPEQRRAYLQDVATRVNAILRKAVVKVVVEDQHGDVVLMARDANDPKFGIFVGYTIDRNFGDWKNNVIDTRVAGVMYVTRGRGGKRFNELHELSLGKDGIAKKVAANAKRCHKQHLEINATLRARGFEV